jgi:hypothetical protein
MPSPRHPLLRLWAARKNVWKLDRSRGRQPARPRLWLEILEPRAVPTVTAVNESFSTIPNTPTVLNVLQPDTVASNEPVSLLSVSAVSPSGPTLTQNADGSLTFTSAATGTYTFDQTITGTQQEMTANNGGSGTEFGQSVAISGNTAVVGASRQGWAAMPIREQPMCSR